MNRDEYRCSNIHREHIVIIQTFFLSITFFLHSRLPSETVRLDLTAPPSTRRGFNSDSGLMSLTAACCDSARCLVNKRVESTSTLLQLIVSAILIFLLFWCRSAAADLFSSRSISNGCCFFPFFCPKLARQWTRTTTPIFSWTLVGVAHSQQVRFSVTYSLYTD